MVLFFRTDKYGCLSNPFTEMTFEQTAGGSGPGSPGDEGDVGEVVTMLDVLKDGRDMEENAKVQNRKYQTCNIKHISGSARRCLRE